jgi:hypothetical protein
MYVHPPGRLLQWASPEHTSANTRCYILRTDSWSVSRDFCSPYYATVIRTDSNCVQYSTLTGIFRLLSELTRYFRPSIILSYIVSVPFSFVLSISRTPPHPAITQPPPLFTEPLICIGSSMPERSAAVCVC